MALTWHGAPEIEGCLIKLKVHACWVVQRVVGSCQTAPTHKRGEAFRRISTSASALSVPTCTSVSPVSLYFFARNSKGHLTIVC
jgi:hypothetical protein